MHSTEKAENYTPTDHDRKIAREAAEQIHNIYSWLHFEGMPVPEERSPSAIILTAIAEAKKPLEEDAARYRFLRAGGKQWPNPWVPSCDMGIEAVKFYCNRDSEPFYEKLSGVELDAVIDAARTQEGKS